MRTGGVFRAIAKHLAAKPKVKVFQFENVLPLATKPTGPKEPKQSAQSSQKNEKEVIGPSNLSSVCAILRNEAQMWSHVWHLDARDFGSGQQRQRLWGLAFRESDLSMTQLAAKELLNRTMDSLVGVECCHPSEYLLPETSAFLKADRAQHSMRSASSDFSSSSSQFDMFFQTCGAVPQKRRRVLKSQNSDSSPINAKWEVRHAEAFRSLGQDIGCRNDIITII